MVGGISALIGAKILGPRIGKYSVRTGKPHAIPGHNIPIGALGVFILWLGWYGFNGAAATSLRDLGSIFLTTTISPAIATVVCYDLYLDQIWQPGCFYVFECLSCRFGCDHCTL